MTAIHHVTLTVSDLAASEAWYLAALGPASVTHRSGSGWLRVRLQWPSGVVIGLTRHEGTCPGDVFDHTRIGLDHVSIACADEDEVRAKARHLDEFGIQHGPVEAAPYGWAVTARDPDGIAVEFFAAKST